MHIPKNLAHSILLIGLMLTQLLGIASNVNILTWENMFDSSPSINTKLKKIEQLCNAKIYFDNYTNNTDFLEQLQRHNYNYDIVVAPNTFLNLITDYIPKAHNPGLKKATESYNTYIKSHFKSIALPSNTAYFVQSLTGLLINSEKLDAKNITDILSLTQLLDNDMILLVLDDPVEISAIIERSRSHNHRVNTNSEQIIKNIQDFSKATENKNVTIVNFYNDRMSKNNFAAAISWSGDALVDLNRLNKRSNQYKFITPINLSFISSDLLVQLNRKTVTDCVMNNISDKDFLNELAYQTNYFSPFIGYDSLMLKQTNYYDMQMIYLDYLPHANWLDSINNTNFEKVQYEWEKYKFNTIRQKNKNNKH